MDVFGMAETYHLPLIVEVPYFAMRGGISDGWRQ